MTLRIHRPSSHSSLPTLGHCVTLEPRHLLAATFLGTDTDGDNYTIKLTGPGSITAITNQGGTTGFLQSLSFSSTDATSKLSITVKKVAAGNGRLRIDALSGASDIRSISASKSDMPSTGTVVLGRIRELSLGEVAGSATLNIGGGDNDRTDLSFARLGGGTTAQLNVGARVGVLEVNVGFFACTLLRGADSITVSSGTNIFPTIPVNALFPISIGKVIGNNTGVFIEGNVGGRIGRINGTAVGLDLASFGSIGSIKATTGDVFGSSTGGPIDSITAKQRITISLTVDRVGTIFAGQSIEDFTLKLSSPDSNGVSLKRIKAPRIDNSIITVTNGGTPGIIKSIQTTSTQDSQLDVEAAAVQTVKAKGGFVTTMNLAGGVFPVRVASISVGARLQATISCDDAGISTIKAGELRLSGFRALFIGEVSVVKGTGGSGELENVLLRAVGSNPLTGFGVKKVTTAGSASDLRLRSFGPVGTVDVLALGDDSIIYSGDTAGGGLPADLSTFDAVGRIDSVKVRKSFSIVSGHEAFNTSAIVAPTIKNISINGKINPDFGGTLFGIGFRTVTGQIAFKDNTGTLIKPTFAAVPATLSLFAGSGDFVIRVYA